MISNNNLDFLLNCLVIPTKQYYFILNDVKYLFFIRNIGFYHRRVKINDINIKPIIKNNKYIMGHEFKFCLYNENISTEIGFDDKIFKQKTKLNHQWKLFAGLLFLTKKYSRELKIENVFINKNIDWRMLEIVKFIYLSGFKNEYTMHDMVFNNEDNYLIFIKNNNKQQQF